jgi:hypothetical protein
MQHKLNVELLDKSKPVAVAPTELTVFIPEELPEGDTIRIAVEAVEVKPMWRATIYREVDLPKAAVLSAFQQQGLKLVIKEDVVGQLLAMFNYKLRNDENS